MSAIGTKRTCRDLLADVRFRGQSGHCPSDRLMSAFDPKRTLDIYERTTALRLPIMHQWPETPEEDARVLRAIFG